MDETNFDSLPVDIILHLFNYYLNEKDCTMFSLSGVSARFSSLWRERRILSIQKCYFVTQSLFHKYVSIWICPEVVTRLDISHCYWLPSNFLLDVVTSMSQLTSLSIQDTKLNLSHLGQIFKKCHLIEKISISLSENDGDILEEMQEHKALMSKGFIKLTHIKILAFNAAYYIDSWLLILQLLSYCRNCVDLHLEIIYDSNEYFRYGPFGKLDYDDVFVSRVRDEFFPHLSWMAYLKNFVILKRIAGSISYPENRYKLNIPDKCIEALVNWVFSQYEMNYIECIWIMEDVDGILPDVMASGKQLKSFCCGELSSSFEEIGKDAVQFGQLEHIGGVGLGHAGILPNLRYIHGYSIDAEGVDELCRTHPKLQHLHLNDNLNRDPFHIKNDWMLNDLKTLVYSCCGFPRKDILETFLNASPNIEELHIIGDIGVNIYSKFASLLRQNNINGAVTADCLKMIGLRCVRLTTLSLSGFCFFEGVFFETIFSGCPQLRNLHLCPFGLGYANCLKNLCRFLPLAENLRDLRLQLKFEGLMLNTVMNALLENKKLQRIVLYEEMMDKDLGGDGPLESQELFKFVREMPHLVCFCFITIFKFEPGFLSELKRKFDEYILPIRPAFWYHVGHSLPEPTNPTVPRIHFDEIVSPIRYFEMLPPDFL